MGVLNTFSKDPRSKLDYSIKWSTWLNGDQITGSSWTAAPGNPVGIYHENADAFTTGSATLWLSSGIAFRSYRFENQIGTLAGREANRSIVITVKDE